MPFPHNAAYVCNCFHWIQNEKSPSLSFSLFSSFFHPCLRLHHFETSEKNICIEGTDIMIVVVSSLRPLYSSLFPQFHLILPVSFYFIFFLLMFVFSFALCLWWISHIIFLYVLGSRSSCSLSWEKFWNFCSCWDFFYTNMCLWNERLSEYLRIK